MSTPDSSFPHRDALETNMSLILRAQTGDPTAWNRIVNLYTPLIDYWIRQRGISGHDLENIRQEVFVRLAKSLTRFSKSEGGSFRGWLRTITGNLINNRSRDREPPGMGGTVAQQMIQEIESNLPELHSLFDTLSKDHPVETKIIFGRIMDWIATHHSPQQATVFRKLVLEGQSPAEIAREMNISVNIVYQTKSRILARVRDAFADIV